MEDLRPDALQTVAARVAAWHNRHPLARRIVAEQVQSVGFVALPYLPAAGQAAKPANQTGKPGPSQEASGEAGLSLRERAQARQAAGSTRAAAPAGEAAAPPVGPKPKLKAAFSEDFIAPLSPRRVARWAMRHGVPLAQAPRGAPLRNVVADPLIAEKGQELQTLYVLTAMVELRGKRIRMLLSPGAREAVLGTRLWSPPRLAMGAGTLGSLAAAAATVALLWPSTPAPAQPKAAKQELSAAAGPVPPTALMPSIRPTSMRAEALVTLNALATPPAPAGAMGVAGAHAAAAPPVDVEPTLGRVSLPSLGLPHGDSTLAAARDRRMAQRGASIASAPQPPLPAASANAAVAAVTLAVAPVTAASAAGPAGPVFALSSRRLRTRAESDQTQVALKSLLAGAGHNGLQVEVVPADDDWRVVGWPFPQRAQAEKAKVFLATRGIRMEVVDF